MSILQSLKLCIKQEEKVASALWANVASCVVREVANLP